MTAPHGQFERAGQASFGLGILKAVEDRVLWLSTAIIDHANRVRPNPTGLKVGGHQASSASMVTIMTSLWFRHLRRGRPGLGQAARVPGAARDQLPARPARRVLPDDAAAVRRPAVLPEPDQGPRPGGLLDRLGRHRGDGTALGSARAPLRRRSFRRGRRRAPVLAARRRRTRRGRRLGGGRSTRWSPTSARSCGSSTSTGSRSTGWCPASAARLQGMFEAAGWQVITVKYGRLLEELFARPGGELLRSAIDQMPNPEYQRLLRCRADELRDRLPGAGPGRGAGPRAARGRRRRRAARGLPQPRRSRPSRRSTRPSPRSTTPARR